MVDQTTQIDAGSADAIDNTEQEAVTMIKLPRKKGPAQVGTKLGKTAGAKAKQKAFANTEIATAPNAEAGCEPPAEGISPQAQAINEFIAEQPGALAQINAALAAPGGTEWSQPVLSAPAAQIAPKPKPSTATVIVVLPFKGQSSAFVEVVIADKPSWLAKSSLASFEVEDGMVTLELPRTLARRRGLLAA